jgi:hypothetical protein
MLLSCVVPDGAAVARSRRPTGCGVDYLSDPGVVAGLLGCSAPLTGCLLAFGEAGAEAGDALVDSPPAGDAGLPAGFGCALVADIAARAAGLAEVAELLFIVLERVDVVGLLAVTLRGCVCPVATLRPPVAFPQPLSARLSTKGASAHFRIFIGILLLGYVSLQQGGQTLREPHIRRDNPGLPRKWRCNARAIAPMAASACAGTFLPGHPTIRSEPNADD